MTVGSKRDISDVVDEDKELLKTRIAGQDLGWNEFERYMTRAKPITLKMIIKSVKIESYLAAVRGEVGKNTKLALGVIIAAVIAIIIIYFLMFMPGQAVEVATNATLP